MKTIIVNTRPEHQAEKLTLALKKIGCEVITLPLMTIEPIALSLKQIDVDTAIFLSVNAVEHFFNQATLQAKNIIAIGPATADALKKKGMKGVLLPRVFSSDGLLSMPLLQEINDKKIAIISGENSKKTLFDVLKQREAIVSSVICYRRKKIRYDVEDVFSKLSLITDILVTSSENLEALLTLFKAKSDWLITKNLTVINDDMKKTAIAFGFKRVMLADNATDEAIVTTYLREKTMTTEPSARVKKSMWRYTALILSVIALIVSIFSYVASRNTSLELELQAIKTNVAGLSQNLSGTTLGMQQQLLALKNNTSLSSQKILAEVSFLATVAQTQLNIDHNVDAALQALGSAQALLASANDPSVMPIAAAIQTDRELLSKIAPVNQAMLFGQVSSLMQKVESLTTLPQPPTTSFDTKVLKNTQKTWHEKWDDVLSQLKKLIVIRHVNDATPPLIAPSMEMNLKQNIVTQLMIAQWALLHHDQTVYQLALENAKAWTAHYFALTPQKDDVTAALTQLMGIDIAPALPALSNTFNAIAAVRATPIASRPITNNTAQSISEAPATAVPSLPLTRPAPTPAPVAPQPDQNQSKPPLVRSPSIEA